jgi:hypothetical protein
MCIRRFYCLYGDSMNVAARMSANAKESGVCVSPQIAAHLASASLPRRSSFPSVWIGSDCAAVAAHPASPAAHCASATADAASPAAHTASDVPSEELQRPSMRVCEAESVCEMGYLETLNTRHTPPDPSLRDTRVSSACATTGLV